MLSENIVLALIVAATTGITTTIAPVAMALVTARQARKDRQEDYARQDAVAAKAAQVAHALQEQGGQIHELVNSNLTAIKEQLAVAKQEIADLKLALEQKANLVAQDSPS